MQIASDAALGRLQFRESVAVANGPLRVSSSSKPMPWYLRLTVDDEPGIVASVANAIARQGINIESVRQDPSFNKHPLSFIITLEPVPEPAVAAAIAEIDAMHFMHEPLLALPMLG